MINEEVKNILRKHYIQILEELNNALKVDNIQAIIKIELKYSDNEGDKFKIN